MNGKILIADDEQEIRELLKNILTCFSNYAIDEAENGIEAQKLIETNSYDFVFLDIYMPELDGYSVLKREMNYLQETIIIVMTGYPLLKKFLANNLKTHEYLEKPFSIEDVISVIEKYSCKE